MGRGRDRRRATVVDLGCGPGAFLPAWSDHTGPTGTVVGVDAAAEAVAAENLVRERRLESRVRVRRARVQDTGLPGGSFRVAVIRNVLIHNGPSVPAILDEVRRLLGTGHATRDDLERWEAAISDRLRNTLLIAGVCAQDGVKSVQRNCG